MLIKVDENLESCRLDSFLTVKLNGFTRSAVQHIIDDGNVALQGKPIKKNHMVRKGEEYTVTLPAPHPIDALPQEIALEVAYEDDDIIVVNKPRGMVVHPAAGHFDGTLVNALLAHCGDSLSGINGAIRPGIVHRIDKDTSGLIIAAKNDAAHVALAMQLKDHSLARTYRAVVCGSLKADSGTIETLIGRSTKDRKKMAVLPTGGKKAITHYRVLARCDGFTYVECKLETGRTHQIRVHMASLGHPIAGDPLYGCKTDKTGLLGQCLHAKELCFIHPKTGVKMQINCDLPPYFTEFLNKIGVTNEKI